MTDDKLTALAARLRDHASDYITHPDDACKHSDLLAASEYLRQCAEAEPVATVRVHDTGGNAWIAWSGVPTEHAGTMRDVAREAAEVERARVLQAGVPGRWADIVEQRLLTWRQRFTNRSDDQLALDDFMDQQSIDDLVDFVCDEHAAPQPPSASPFPISYDRPTDVLTINGKRYAACLFDARGLLAPAGTVFRIEDGPDDTVTLTRLQQPPSAQADAVEALRGVASEHDIGYAAGWRSCADEAARIVASHIDRLEPGRQQRMRDALLALLASMRSILVVQRAVFAAPQPPSTQADAVEALRELVEALDGAYISSWQSTAAWQTQLDRARAVLAAQGGNDE